MARWVGRMAVAAWVAVAVSCGGAQGTEGRVRGGVYVVGHADLWSVVREEVERAYGIIALERDGRIESMWRLYDRVGEPKLLGKNELRPGDTVFRVSVRVRQAEDVPGGWLVRVDGLSAGFAKDMKPRPYPRGDKREPPWVQEKIDALAQAIHSRLSEYHDHHARR